MNQVIFWCSSYHIQVFCIKCGSDLPMDRGIFSHRWGVGALLHPVIYISPVECNHWVWPLWLWLVYW